MKKLFKIAASAVMYSAVAFVAMNAVFHMDATSLGFLVATAFSVGMIHDAIWA